MIHKILLLFLVNLLLSTSIVAQKCNEFSENGKIFKTSKLKPNGGKIKVWNYRFFNGEIIEIDCNKEGLIGKQNLFFKNTCEKEEIASLNEKGNVISKSRLFYVELYGEEKKYEGNIAKEHKSKNGYRESSKFYHPNGNIKEIGNYLHGSRHGQWKIFHSNGQLRSIENWESNKREGQITFYYDNGNFWSEGIYKNNKQIGEWKFYDRNQNLKLVKIGRYPEKINPKAFLHEIDEWEFYDNNKLIRIKRFNYEIMNWEFYDKKGARINWSEE